jgi:hypothetical protein
MAILEMSDGSRTPIALIPITVFATISAIGSLWLSHSRHLALDGYRACVNSITLTVAGARLHSEVAISFDHLIRSREDGLGNSQTNGTGSFEVHRKNERNGLFDGEIGRTGPFEDPVHEIS